MKIILFCNKGFTIFKFSLINVYYTISMELFLKILEQLIQSAQIVKRNKDLEQICWDAKNLATECIHTWPADAL